MLFADLLSLHLVTFLMFFFYSCRHYRQIRPNGKWNWGCRCILSLGEVMAHAIGPSVYTIVKSCTDPGIIVTVALT